VIVRAASPSDAEAIASLLRASFAEFEALYTPEAFAATTPQASTIRARFQEGPTWVAFDGILVGTVSALPTPDGVYLRSMAVRPASRGHGIAKRLIDRVDAFAIEQSRGRVYLSTTPFLAAAIRAYERAGFRRTDRGPNELFGTPLFSMEKEVSTLSPSTR
jgi:GNAT superfamily N-acetyltransferase